MKRLMTITKERGLEKKTFRQKGPSQATMDRATVLEKTTSEFEIELLIDYEAIFKFMGTRAALSKSGKCRDGYVTVKAKKKRELAKTTEPIPIPPHLEEVQS